jgi:hypothetical protein
MSEVEALLAVDAGRVPPGTAVFFARDPEVAGRRLGMVLAVVADAFAVWLAVRGNGAGAALLALLGVLLALGAVPTKPADERPSKRPTLLITQTGLIVRGAHGLASFSFDEIANVHGLSHEPHIGLLVVRRDGKRFFIETGSFEGGGEVSVLVGRRLASRTA